MIDKEETFITCLDPREDLVSDPEPVLLQQGEKQKCNVIREAKKRIHSRSKTVLSVVEVYVQVNLVVLIEQ